MYKEVLSASGDLDDKIEIWVKLIKAKNQLQGGIMLVPK